MSTINQNRLRLAWGSWIGCWGQMNVFRRLLRTSESYTENIQWDTNWDMQILNRIIKSNQIYIFTYLYIILACLSVCLFECLFVCLYPIYVKTAEPLGPKFFVGHHVTTGKVYEWSKFQIFVSIKIRSSLNFWKFENPRNFL